MTNTTVNPSEKQITRQAGDLKLVCNDSASGQSITIGEVDGRQVITHSCQEAGETKTVTLTDSEAAEIIAWKNSGRRNSFWNWPEWDAVRNRSKINP